MRVVRMIAIDTNVLVRLVTNDDPAQGRRAAELFHNHDIFVPKTVLLESEWVLRYAYQLAPDRIAAALRGVLGLPRVTVEDPGAVTLALERFEAGLDFADALHWASSQHTERFVTFDQKLTRRARALGHPNVGAP
jgi:predicted nucleic-acid-binding protein